ncbi:hypothetical protein J2T19_002538 [Paenibacillus tundrae]|uniref:Uncharacterized protein n=1 Tax=Paenibacillus tundrae TaxID=528187 RepID=A0ABT9WCV6_9BACL|nr:hypothetical protein [Paenibacillus tundrae]
MTLVYNWNYKQQKSQHSTHTIAYAAHCLIGLIRAT